LIGTRLNPRRRASVAPDHGPFSGSVGLEDAEPVIGEIISLILVRLRRIPDREIALSFAPVPYHPAEQAGGTR
jgi:hypothetical protein